MLTNPEHKALSCCIFLYDKQISNIHRKICEVDVISKCHAHLQANKFYIICEKLIMFGLVMVNNKRQIYISRNLTHQTLVSLCNFVGVLCHKGQILAYQTFPIRGCFWLNQN